MYKRQFYDKEKDELMSRESSFTVRDLPRQERPRERLQKFGPEALSAQELLALVIGRGIPKKISIYKAVIELIKERLEKVRRR